MRYEDFDDDAKIKQVFLKELAESLKASLNASRVQIFEHLIRKANPNFPLRSPEEWKYIQPTTVYHVGMTRALGATMARRLNHKIWLPDVPFHNYQYINIWKPLRGPVRDWPLALCDPKSVSPASLQDGDVVFEDFVIENKLLHHESTQKWYYASNQDTDEVWLFLQADSSANVLGGGLILHFGILKVQRAYSHEKVSKFERSCIIKTLKAALWIMKYQSPKCNSLLQITLPTAPNVYPYPPSDKDDHVPIVNPLQSPQNSSLTSEGCQGQTMVLYLDIKLYSVSSVGLFGTPCVILNVSIDLSGT
ncbi:hypothetical protein BDZ45DRAFT_809874 [Acephala macrosclerotiorum]|nr:hypothetical protein BDZ45DRAFT_809874 [Acephala macrosclerotiorum]